MSSTRALAVAFSLLPFIAFAGWERNTSSATQSYDPTDEAKAKETINLSDYFNGATAHSGLKDITDALANAIRRANSNTRWTQTHQPEPTCIYISAGSYVIKRPPPMFEGAGCVIGAGALRTIINIDPLFTGDLFSWAEAWDVYGTSGATIRGLRINGSRQSARPQNALMFYDRNDAVLVDDIQVFDLPGTALALGLLRETHSSGQAYVRESTFAHIRIMGCGRPDAPAMIISTQGSGNEDGANELDLSWLDIFASHGPSLMISNGSDKGFMRDIKFLSLRIEGPDASPMGKEALAAGSGDLLVIGTKDTKGPISHLDFSSMELLNPSKQHAALRMTSSEKGGKWPAMIYLQGYIGGGLAKGTGLEIESGAEIRAVLSQLKTDDTNVIIGHNVSNVLLDGGGAEGTWTTRIDASSRPTVFSPARERLVAKGKELR